MTGIRRQLTETRRQADGNPTANTQSLYPLKSPSTAGLHTNVGTDFPYALSKYPLVCRFAPSSGI